MEGQPCSWSITYSSAPTLIKPTRTSSSRSSGLREKHKQVCWSRAGTEVLQEQGWDLCFVNRCRNIVKTAGSSGKILFEWDICLAGNIFGWHYTDYISITHNLLLLIVKAKPDGLDTNAGCFPGCQHLSNSHDTPVIKLNVQEMTSLTAAIQSSQL